MANKFEKEIEELLRRLDAQNVADRQESARPGGWTSWMMALRCIMARRWGFLTTEQLIGLLIALGLFSYVSRFALPAIGRYVMLGFLVGMAVLVFYVLSQEFLRRRR
ncbi:MAG: hypothetical protein EPO21_18660 [Chloroflexota bacterium]|nr:MAG: hypothetical protein EPO21_18660 [Chloroflexota bacterium]